MVSDVLWQRLEPHLPGKVSDAGATAKDNRLFLEAVFWRVRTGSPWRELPPAFGHWNSQFRRWARSGIFDHLFNAMSGDPDLDYARIDGTIVQAHQKATGAKGGLRLRPLGAPAAGLTTKVVALVDALGNLVRFLLLLGQAQDMKGVAPLIKGVACDALRADNAFDADWV